MGLVAFVLSPGLFISGLILFFVRNSMVQNKFGSYMKQHHPEEWSGLSKYTGIFHFDRNYGTKAIHDFIWKSTETFGDEMITEYRNIIKSLTRISLLCLACACLGFALMVIFLGHIEPKPTTIRQG